MGRGTGRGDSVGGTKAGRRSAGEEGVPVSEGTRELLVNNGDSLHEFIRESAWDLEQGTPFEELPNDLEEYLPSAYARHYTPEFLRRFAEAVKGVSGKIADEDCYLAATIEELAAHALFSSTWSQLESAPDLIAADYGIKDLDLVKEELSELAETVFEDDDVLMLFDPSLDGIEDAPEGEDLGLTNLRFEDWFKPFRPDVPEELYPVLA